MNDSPPNLVLAGFMGTGKTTTGTLLAERLGLPFYDTDHLIVARAGMSVPQIFAAHGEAEFRRIEREVCAEISTKRGQIIATGGGMLVNPDNLAVMQQNGVVICLWAAAEDLQKRLTVDPSRPLAAGWANLLEQRRTLYETMPHHIMTTGKTPVEVAEEAAAIWQRHSR